MYVRSCRCAPFHLSARILKAGVPLREAARLTGSSQAEQRRRHHGAVADPCAVIRTGAGLERRPVTRDENVRQITPQRRDDTLSGQADNDTYAFNTNSQLNSDNITESAGTDQLTFVGSTNDVAVSLGLTTQQTVNANLKVTLASATSIENLYGGSGNDTVL